MDVTLQKQLAREKDIIWEINKPCNSGKEQILIW